MAKSILLRQSVVALHLTGKKPVEIFRLLQHQNISKSFVEYTIRRYRDNGSVVDRPRLGRPCSARTKETLRKVKGRIARNPKRSQRKMAAELNVSKSTIQRILTKDLRLKPLKKVKVQILTAQQKLNRKSRCKRLLRRFANCDLENILFTDEKIFTIEEKHHSQNDRIYATSRKTATKNARRILRKQAFVCHGLGRSIHKRVHTISVH